MLMQRFELCNLLRSEERLDLRVCALHQRLYLLMFLLFGQARVLMYCLELRISGNQNRPDLSLLGVVEAELGRQPCELLFGAWGLVLPQLWPVTGRLVCARRGLGQGETGKECEGNK